MEAKRRAQLIRLRTVAKFSITRMQSFIETGDRKLNDIEFSYDELSNIYKQVLNCTE